MKKIAIVYDWIDKWGGGERLLLILARMFPQAVFFSSYVDFEKAPWAKKLKIQPSFIQRLPALIRKNRLLSLPFYAYAFESFDFSHFDLVISVTSAFAKGIITKPETKHLCYLLTPTRFIWPMTEIYLGPGTKNIFLPSISLLRKWDFIASQRPDKILSISQTIKKRCFKYYRRNSQVIYPPFDVAYWREMGRKMAKLDFGKKEFF